MKILFKIIETYPDSRTLRVRFYTDGMLAAYPAELDRRTAQVMVSDPQKTKAEARAYAERAWPCGGDSTITLPDPMPTGGELIRYISRQAPTAWLELKDKIAREGPPDMSTIPCGVECVVVEEVAPPLPPAEASLPGEIIAKPLPL